MILYLLLFLDFGLLALVTFIYLRKILRERQQLRGQADKSLELQQKVYQIQVLQEISERIGYSLEGSKVIEIITNSIGNLLEYETVSFILYSQEDPLVFKCHVHKEVNHRFISQVKDNMLAATNVLCGLDVTSMKFDERMGGAILDDSLDVEVKSYLNIPVIIGNSLLGLINISSSKPGLFKWHQSAILYTITNQAAVAVSQLQTMLENEKGKLLGIIASMTDGVMMVDLQNQVQITNPAVAKLLHLLPDKQVTMFDIVDSLAGKVDLRTKVEESLTKDQPIAIKEVFLHDQALEITISPVRDKNGEHRGAAVIFHDVTSSKSLEKLRQEFTAMMVHELRAPLTAVRWSSETLLSTLKSPSKELPQQKVAESVQNIDTAATNMLDLVNDLLDVAKIEAGKFDLNLQEYNLTEIIKSEISTFSSLAESKHLNINFTNPGDVKVVCDKVRVGQVLSNLISNSIKYTDSGEISVNLVEDNAKNKVIISVKDSGLGVSREDLAVLFSKFKQLKSFDRSRKGTGLGLVVSKGIVEAHGGMIWAESAGENLGSTFSFTLPKTRTI